MNDSADKYPKAEVRDHWLWWDFTEELKLIWYDMT